MHCSQKNKILIRPIGPIINTPLLNYNNGILMKLKCPVSFFIIFPTRSASSSFSGTEPAQNFRRFTYLMALLNFSYVIFSFFFLFPHKRATLLLWTNLNVPSSKFSHFMSCGQVLLSRNRCSRNSQSFSDRFPKKNVMYCITAELGVGV